MAKVTVLAKHLHRLGACSESLIWIEGRTPKQAWEACDRADWLLWWAAKTSVNSHQQVVLAACACARLALRHVPPGEDRPQLAIEAAERWAANPNVRSRADASAAYAAASAAYASADAAYAASSAYAAASAAYASADAAYAASSASAAAYAAASAAADAAAAYAADAADAAAKKREHEKMCKIIRSMLTLPYRKATEGQA